MGRPVEDGIRIEPGGGHGPFGIRILVFFMTDISGAPG
jgi:hypothetical protein